MITFSRLKYLSFAHSAIYFTLLVLWLADGPDELRVLFGWAHGIGWIVMSLLCIAAVRMRVIPLWLGPFAGSISFIVCERRTAPAERALERGMV